MKNKKIATLLIKAKIKLTDYPSFKKVIRHELLNEIQLNKLCVSYAHLMKFIQGGQVGVFRAQTKTMFYFYNTILSLIQKHFNYFETRLHIHSRVS